MSTTEVTDRIDTAPLRQELEDARHRATCYARILLEYMDAGTDAPWAVDHLRVHLAEEAEAKAEWEAAVAHNSARSAAMDGVAPLLDKIRSLRSTADLRADDDEGRTEDFLARTERPE